MNQKSVNKLTSAAKLRLIDSLLATTVYVPVWHSRYTRATFAVLVSCSEELAFHSCQFLCLQRHVAETCERIVLLLVFIAYNSMVSNLQRFASSYGSKRFTACHCL